MTGASSGIGEAIARELIRCGFAVYGTSRSARNPSPEGIAFLQLDVDDDASVREQVGWLLGEIGQLDLLVNCAGLGILGAIEEIPIELARQHFETNFFGVLRMVQAVAPHMRRRRQGLIINISSIAGGVSLPLRGIYSASKAAMEAMSEALRMELKPFGVQVTILQPGDFKTGLEQNRIHVHPSADSPYALLFQEMEAQITKGMNAAPSPEPVAHRIADLIDRPRPRVRYRVGSLVEVMTPWLKTLLPASWFERLLMSFFKLNDKRLLK